MYLVHQEQDGSTTAHKQNKLPHLNENYNFLIWLAILFFIFILSFKIETFNQRLENTKKNFCAKELWIKCKKSRPAYSYCFFFTFLSYNQNIVDFLSLLFCGFCCKFLSLLLLRHVNAFVSSFCYSLVFALNMVVRFPGTPICCRCSAYIPCTKFPRYRPTRTKSKKRCLRNGRYSREDTNFSSVFRCCCRSLNIHPSSLFSTLPYGGGA